MRSLVKLPHLRKLNDQRTRLRCPDRRRPVEKKAGDIGTIVRIHGENKGYKVEFMTLAGQTLAVVTLLPPQIRPITRRDLAHVRKLATA